MSARSAVPGPSRSLDVGIVGAGTAGASLALLLARDGHRVTIYEAVPDPRPVGAGIVLQPSGQAVLAALDLLGPILDRGARIDRLHCVRALGASASDGLRTVVDLGYGDLGRADLFGLGLHRGALFSVLHAALERAPGVTLHTGIEVTEVRGDRDRREVVAQGVVRGAHELVVIADGAGSDVALSDGLPRRSVPYRWGALWFVADDPEQVFRGELYQVVRGTERMMGLLPTGTAPEAETPVVSVYWSVREDRFDALREGTPALFAEMARLDPRAERATAQVRSPEQLLFARYRDVTAPNRRWHGGRTVRIGDAAHATSPQLGQGANLALIDAATLATAIAAHRDVEPALAAYSAARGRHLGYYQFATRWLTPFFQSDHAMLGALRDVFLPIGLRVPWVRRQMVMSMAGIHRGLFRKPMPLALPRLSTG